ncbi:hypothetical protein [Arthrobacter sp. NPDC056493]|uniref:hypothetical protein n=1 Tax=Arthrobacter sp. NPDC056493 TaxID=3345839 RepID=UPI00367197AE
MTSREVGKREAQKPVARTASHGGVTTGLPEAMTGRASPAKAALEPVPPVTPVGMGKSTPGVELESMDDIDERQVAAWMKQVASVPGVGGKKR